MKKRWFSLIGVAFLFAGCGSTTDADSPTTGSTATEVSSSEQAEWVNFYSDDDQEYTLELADGWEMYDDPEELVDGGNASFEFTGTSYTSYGALVIYNAVDYESFDTFLDLSYEAIELPEGAEPEEFKTDEFEGMRYSYQEDNEGMTIEYAFYLIRNEDHYINSQVWSSPSQFEKVSAGWNDMMLSMRLA